MTTATDALARLDDGVLISDADRAVLAVFEKHCQDQAFVWPEPLCAHGEGPDCNACFLDYDDQMRRAEDQ